MLLGRVCFSKLLILFDTINSYELILLCGFELQFMYVWNLLWTIKQACINTLHDRICIVELYEMRILFDHNPIVVQHFKTTHQNLLIHIVDTARNKKTDWHDEFFRI